MNKELTPIQELIEMCETLIKNSSNKAVYEALGVIKFRANRELLPKEKQVIEDAYEQGGFDEETIHPAYLDAQDYYNQKFRK